MVAIILILATLHAALIAPALTRAVRFVGTLLVVTSTVRILVVASALLANSTTPAIVLAAAGGVAFLVVGAVFILVTFTLVAL